MEETQVIEFSVRYDQLDQFVTCSKKKMAGREAYFRVLTVIFWNLDIKRIFRQVLEWKRIQQ